MYPEISVPAQPDGTVRKGQHKKKSTKENHKKKGNGAGSSGPAGFTMSKTVTKDNYTIGIVGGMGSYATLKYFERILEAFPAERD